MLKSCNYYEVFDRLFAHFPPVSQACPPPALPCQISKCTFLCVLYSTLWDLFCCCFCFISFWKYIFPVHFTYYKNHR